MPKDRTDSEPFGDGSDRHPAFGMISVHRIQSTPGEILFQSDIRHSSYVRIEVHEADRHRENKHDWVFPGKLLCEVSMSEAQFASFVASGGTTGVPCTIERVNEGDYGLGNRPGLSLSPRLQLTSEEVRNAAQAAYQEIKEALSTYEETLNESGKGSTAAKKHALNMLRSKVNNATPNIGYATRRLNEHAEDVIEKSRADIESMVMRMAEQNGIDRGDLPAIDS